MKKTLSLMLAVVLASTVSFAQYYASKQDAKNGKLSLFEESPQNNSNKAVNATFFSEDFEGDLSVWNTYDEDGDGNHWGITGNPNGLNGGQCAYSASWASGTGALTPDNWLCSNAIDLSTAGASTLFDFWRKGLDQTWANEVFSVYISTSGNTVADFTGSNGTVLIDQENVIADDWQKRSISLAAYTGGTVYIAFRHHNVTDMFQLVIDDIEIYESTSIDGGITEFLSPNNDTSCILSATEDVTVTIFNYGGAALTGFEASYTINGGTPVTETVSASIPVASSIDFTFSQQADLSALDYYNIEVSLNITDDANTANNNASSYVANGDASMTVDVSSDAQGTQAWYIINMVTSDTVASHGAYQWNLVNDITTVCLNSAHCYKFSWIGGTSNDVILSYEGNQIDSRTATEDYIFNSIGSGCPNDDVIVSNIAVSSIVAAGNIDVSGTVTNTGIDPLTSFAVVYSIDGTTTSATYYANCYIVTGETFDFTHNEPWNAPIGNHILAVTVSDANGNGVNNHSMDKDIFVINEAFPKTVVYEEGTGTWCGWCVRGHVGLNTMHHNITDGSWVGVAVHNGDPMTITEYDTPLSEMTFASFPNGVVNRFPDPTDPTVSVLETAYQEHLMIVPLAKVEIDNVSWDNTTREIDLTVKTTFGTDMASADYNVAVIVIEDSIVGTGTDYDQANYYANAGAGPMIDWDGTDYTALPDPIPAADMMYNHVARALLGGWDGAPGSVPSNVTYNVEYDYNFTHTLPVDQVFENISLVAIIIDNATGQIINASHGGSASNLAFYVTTTNIKSPASSNFKIYPNPSKGLVKIEGVEGAKIMVYNMIGELIYTEGNVSATRTIDLSQYNAGNYIVKIINNDKVFSQKILINK